MNKGNKDWAEVVVVIENETDKQSSISTESVAFNFPKAIGKGIKLFHSSLT